MLRKDRGEVGKEEIKQMFYRGVQEGNFRVLSKEGEKYILSGPHFVCNQILTRNQNSKFTPLRHITNPSIYTASHV